MINIILFGPPGCGKGTQAKIIANNFGYTHLSTGIIFRDHIKRNTKLGKIVNYYINKGLLVPDFTTITIINKELKKYLGCKGLIYDGYPRTIKQAFYLEKTLKKLSLGKINIIFHLKMNNNLIIDRLLKRAKTSLRYDDSNLSIVKNRIKEYNRKTSLIWKNTKWENYIITIKAYYSINDIFILIEKQIKYFIKNKKL